MMSKRIDGSSPEAVVQSDEEDDDIPVEEYSEVVVEERDTLITSSSVMAPSEYASPEYEQVYSPEK